MTQRLRVVKLGGSLLDDARTPERLRRWLATQTAGPVVLIVGGGGLVDEVRALDRLHKLGDETAHWLALGAMRVTAAVVSAWLPEAIMVRDWQTLREQAPPLAILDVWEFCQADRKRSDALPATWDTTSDSIAARVAEFLGASELFLLKSVLPKSPVFELGDLAATGYVDPNFPSAAAVLPTVRCVDVSSEAFADVRLARDPQAHRP